MPALETTMETARGAVRFVVASHQPDTQDVLAAMGYLPVDERRSATRWFPRSPGVEACFRRFAASIERMVCQKAGRCAVPWDAYGSSALAVRGLPVQPRDIDVRVDDAALAGAVCDDLLVTPVERLADRAALIRRAMRPGRD